MKKITTAAVALLLMASVAYAQDQKMETKTTKKTETKMKKRHHGNMATKKVTKTKEVKETK